MGALQVTLRTSIAAIILAGALEVRAAPPAVSADLQLTGGFTPVKGVPPTKIDFGGTISYTYTLRNLAGHSTGVQLDAPTVPAGTTVTAVTGATCSTDADGNLVFPCPIAADLFPADPAIADAVNPNVITIEVTVTLDVPKTPSAAICAGTTPFGNVTVSVSNDPAAAAGPTTDTNPANNTVTTLGATVLEQPFADVAIAVTGPDRSPVGSTVTYATTVTNAGPCPAQNVVVTPVPGNLLTFQSGTAPCTTEGDCNLGTVAAGTTVPFSITYKVAALPSDVIQTTIPLEYDVATDTNNVNADGGVTTTGLRTGKEAGGCNSGGPGGLIAVALMAAAVFAIRRRRTA